MNTVVVYIKGGVAYVEIEQGDVHVDVLDFDNGGCACVMGSGQEHSHEEIGNGEYHLNDRE